MKKNILLAVCFLMPLATMAQNDTLGHERNITLSEAIVLAHTQSVDAAVALNELKTAYWEYRTFRADLLPEVNFTGTLPNYNKSYSTYQNLEQSVNIYRMDKDENMELVVGDRTDMFPEGGIGAVRTAFGRPEHLVYGG